MITKTFAAPIGLGLRTILVAPEAIATGRRITVIVPSMIVFECNWSRRLPNACGITPAAWLRRAEDVADDLIIVDCINARMMDRIRATLESISAEVWVVANGDEDLAPLTRQRALEGMKRLGIVNELEDLVTTLGGEQFKVVDVKVRHGGESRGNAKQLAIYKVQRTNGGGTSGPDITGITPDGRVVEGDFIPAQPKLTADQMRSLMAFFAVPHPADTWAHGPDAPIKWITASAPCAGHSRAMRGTEGLAEQIAAMREPVTEDAPATTANERAAQRTFAKLTGNIQSIDQTELDQLLAPYIRFGLLRTIYTAVTQATEYRGPSGKLIAISLRGNHYRTRDSVLGSSPSLHAQLIGRVRRETRYELVNPKTGEVVGSGTIHGKVIPFPGGAA